MKKTIQGIEIGYEKTDGSLSKAFGLEENGKIRYSMEAISQTILTEFDRRKGGKISPKMISEAVMPLVLELADSIQELFYYTYIASMGIARECTERQIRGDQKMPEMKVIEVRNFSQLLIEQNEDAEKLLGTMQALRIMKDSCEQMEKKIVELSLKLENKNKGGSINGKQA